MFEQAKQDFLLAINLDESFAQAHNNLSGTYLSLGLFVGAFEHCGIAITLDETINNTNYNVALQQLQNMTN